ASDWPSSVQPRVYAFGKQASTIACLFRKSETLYVLPLDAFNAKSDTGSPTFSSVAADTCPIDPNANRHRASIVECSHRISKWWKNWYSSVSEGQTSMHPVARRVQVRQDDFLKGSVRLRLQHKT